MAVSINWKNANFWEKYSKKWWKRKGRKGEEDMVL